MDYKGYKELKCYIEARSLRQYISVLTKKFPPHEKFLLTAQITDSSRSITSNMAEGYGRYTFPDRKIFFTVARGSVTETMEHLATAFDENYITEDEFARGEAKCELVFRLTNGYIAYLERSNNLMSTPKVKPNSKLQNPNS